MSATRIAATHHTNLLHKPMIVMSKSISVCVGLFATLFVCEVLVAQTTITINPNQRRSIGNVSVLERDRFFNYTESLVPNPNLIPTSTIYSASGLNISPGRVSTELDSIVVPFGNVAPLQEDPARPGQGFIDPVQLRAGIQDRFRNFVESSSRYEAIRAKAATSVLVTSGRSFSRWPEYFRTSGGAVSNFFPKKEAYAEFLNIYLDEAVNGPNAFIPVNSDRYHIELLNEPDLHISADFTHQDLIDYHRDVAQLVKAQHPNVSIGGPGLAITGFSGNDFSRWNSTLKPFIEQAGTDVDFYSIHPYERYDIARNGSLIGRRVLQSPGRTNATIDLIQAQQLKSHQNTLPVSLTEYGSFQRYEGEPSDEFYTRKQQQWDLSKDIRDKLFVFLNRPDAILNATPFVQGRDFVNTNGGATRVAGDNVLFEQDTNGQWRETVLAEMFRTYAAVQGEFIGINADNNNVQTVAFRDGDQVFLLLNNLLDSNQQLDLNFLGQFGTVTSATVDRIFQVGSGLSFDTGFEQDVDITSSFGNFTLSGEEGAVITFTLNGADGLTIDTRENTFYSDDIVTVLDGNGVSELINIDAVVADAITAKLRVGFSTDSETPEGFEVFINGQSIGLVSAEALGIDDGDGGHFAREIDVPIALLADGANSVQVDFNGNGGYLSTAALVVTSATAVPEPSSAVLLLLLAGSAMAGRQRKLT